MNKEKLNQLISCMKTTNELMKKQLDINQRCIELLGEFITEPEQVQPETIKPEDMVSGEWYVDSECWLFKFDSIVNDDIMANETCNMPHKTYYNKFGSVGFTYNGLTYRKASQQEVLKCFPNELEVPTHGGNDAGYIDKVTDEKS